MSAPLRILVADDHELVRKGLRTVLQSEAGWVVCGEAANGREAVEKARELRPHVVILDLTMPELNGLEATRQIRSAVPTCEVLILSMHLSEQLTREVLAAGARGYILKSDAGTMILDAVARLRDHAPFFTSKVSALLLSAYLDPERGSAARNGSATILTPREREIVQLIAEGKSGKATAAALGISEKTAETHRANIMRKLDIHSISELVRYAIRNHLIEP